MFRQLGRAGARVGAVGAIGARGSARVGGMAGLRVGSVGTSKTPGFFRSYAITTTGENIESQIDHISDSEYHHISEEYLEGIADDLEVLAESHPELDSELSHGVLTVSVPNIGNYCINKQPTNKQIWFSSPISGPKRYDMIGGKWVELRDHTHLTKLLAEEISKGLETEFEFELVD